MSETLALDGRCLCGAVGVHASRASRHFGACHCKMCRQWGGGPYLAFEAGADVSFDGEEHISVYDSSPWAERGFCRQCGSHLFYRIKQGPIYMLPPGLFDDDAGFVFGRQVFVDRNPGYYRFANETDEMTEAEVFAKYAPPES